MRALTSDPEMVGSVLALAMCLLSKARGSGPYAGTLFASQPALAEETGLSDRQVRRLLHKLIERGYLEQTKRGGRSGDGSHRASEFRLTLLSTGHGVPVDIEPQPDIDDAAERASTGHPCPPKGEELPKEKCIAGAAEPESEIEEAVDYLISWLRRPISSKDRALVLADLQADPDWRRTAQNVAMERPPREVRAPGRFLLNRLAAARNGEIPIRVGGMPAPSWAFSNLKTGFHSWTDEQATGAPVPAGKIQTAGRISWSGGAPAPHEAFTNPGVGSW